MDLAKIGDKVVCNCKGGPHKIVSGASTVFVDDIPAARIGDMSSCGATITTGVDWFEIEDKPAAINGSQTSCGGKVITGSSVTTGSPTSIQVGGFTFQQSSPADADMASVATDVAASQGGANSTPAFSATAATSPTDGNSNSSTVAPGFHIVRQPGTREQIKRRLLANPTPQVDAMFERLNGHLGAYVLPGSMVVLSDPENLTCSAEEEELKFQARQVQQSVQTLELPEAQRMVDHFDTYQEIVSYGSTMVGTAASSLGRATSIVERELKNLAVHYRDAMDPLVKVTKESFIARRDATFQRLDTTLNTVLRKGLNLPEFDVLKARIGVEAQQAVHHGRTALEGFRNFEIPTISEAIAKVGVASKLTSIGSAVGVALDYMATNMEIEKACTLGREEQCTRTKFIEYGKLGGRTFGGIAGAFGGDKLCVGLSLTPQGRLVCSIVLVGAGAVGGMYALEPVGEQFGTLLYEGIYGDGVPDAN